MLKVDEIKDFFKLESSHAKKELGQNFLIDEDIIKKIVSSLDIEDKDKILEIGPGLGSLTDEIIKYSENLTVVEYDLKFYNFLIKSYSNRTKINIIKDNILRFNNYSFDKVIGNLPYYITSDILEYIALNFNLLKKGVFMIQYEAFKRIIAKEGKDFNALNILFDYKYHINQLFIVKKNCFFPEPNVNSVVFSIIPKNDIDNDFAPLLYKVSKILFQNRRKTIQNNLKVLIKDNDILLKVFKESSLNPLERAENLKLNDFINLTNILIKNNLINNETKK